MSPLLDRNVTLSSQAELVKLNTLSILYAVNLIKVNQHIQRTDRQRKFQHVV
jgi:hypothetical protein